MARGNIYELRTDAEATWNITEEMFYEHVGHEFDYVADLDGDESKMAIETFLDTVKGFGAEAGMETVNGEELPYVIFSDKVKEAYFAGRFNQLKNLMSEMDLHEFATSDQNHIKSLIDDGYDDAVYSGDSSMPHTMDYFIREAENGVKYYVGPNVVLMH